MGSSKTKSAAFLIQRADWLRDGDTLRYVRTRVFVEEQAVPPELEWDRKDAKAFHLLAVDYAFHPIGTARLTDAGQIGRMAVLPAWRRRGVGSALLQKTMDLARELGIAAPFLSAQVPVLHFYCRVGFETVGEEFIEAGIPHRRMILRI